MSYRNIIIGAAVLAAIGGAWWHVASNRPPSFGTIAAERGNVIASLDEPGNILTESDVDLSFQEGGSIVAVNVSRRADRSCGDGARGA